MADFRFEFPDFPHDGVPAELLAEEWHDVSWHNDACPSFMREENEWHRVVFVDYPDPEMREFFAEGKRFIVCLTKDGYFMDNDPRLETDLLDEALAFASVSH